MEVIVSVALTGNSRFSLVAIAVDPLGHDWLRQRLSRRLRRHTAGTACHCASAWSSLRGLPRRWRSSLMLCSMPQGHVISVGSQIGTAFVALVVKIQFEVDGPADKSSRSLMEPCRGICRSDRKYTAL